MNGCLVAGPEIDEQAALSAARAFPGLQGMDLAKTVTTDHSFSWSADLWSLGGRSSPECPAEYRVVVMDFGVKRNILRMLVAFGCEVTVVSATATADEILALKPDGVLLSNGPGDPEPCDYAIATIQTLLDSKVVLFGICLGHQLLALASGAKTRKMKCGHHGANYPVVDLDINSV